MKQIKITFLEGKSPTLSLNFHVCLSTIDVLLYTDP